MNKFLLLLLFAFPLFGETIKISFSRQWHPKIQGLNHSYVKFVSSKPMVAGSKKRDGSLDFHEVGFDFTPPNKHYGNILFRMDRHEIHLPESPRSQSKPIR